MQQTIKENTNLEERFVRCYKKYRNKPLKVLLGFYRGSYHRFLLSSFFFLLKHSPALFSPLLIANVINAVLDGNDTMKRIIVNVSVWLGLLAIHLPANWMHNKLKSSTIRSTEAGLRAALVRKLQELSVPYHTGTRSGRLQSKIIRDVEAVETLSSQVFVNILNIVMSLAVTVGITAAKNRVILLFFVIVAPVASITIFTFRKKIREENNAFRKEMEETSARVMEMVEMVPVTRAHALEEVEETRLREQLKETAEKGYRLDMIQSHFGAVSWVVFQAFQAVCLLFSGYMAFKHMIPVGDVTFYQSGFTTVVNQFSSLINLLPILTKGLESVTSIGEVLSCDDVEQNEGKKELDDLRGEFVFDHVSYSYPNSKETVLNDVNITVRPGETIAIVGGSGSGKTTILNMVIGFILPLGGRLLVDGNDISEINKKTFRRFISVVPQTPLLFTGTIRENITYGMENASDEEVMKAVTAANLKSLIEKLPEGLDTRVDEHGGNLSGGQRQRIAIARALIRDPKVIILDEATSALDVVSEKEIQEALDNLIKGRTTFIVAHRLSTVRNADRILVLENGTITEDGSYAELMALDGAFRKMEELQQKLE
ncbi:MAG: ABC transporter ATP-binding protein [Lachnospiraceae bacterium]|nr:ABC transporter ATP-binding protein [Lachnospiraceae bacterium]